MMVIPVTNRQWNGLRKQVSSQPINHGNAPKSWNNLVHICLALISSSANNMSRNHQDISVKSASKDYRWAARQPVYWSGVILSRVLRSGLVTLITNCDPRCLPEGVLTFIMKSLAVRCLLIREINFHIIFPGNEIWRFKGEMQCLATRGQRIPDLAATRNVTQWLLLIFLSSSYFFLKVQTIVAATFRISPSSRILIIKYERCLLIFMFHYWH